MNMTVKVGDDFNSLFIFVVNLWHQSVEHIVSNTKAAIELEGIWKEGVGT
jgi:hypothetical protein